MLDRTTPQLSVILTSNRPQWLANCLNQCRHQSTGELWTELIVVAEGSHQEFDPVLSFYKPDRSIIKCVEGLCGAYAKDEGLRAARGDYVCFWDDDNVYYPHALTTLYAAAQGSDIGIVKTRFMGTRFREIPRTHVIEFGNVDTMCLCVNRAIATKVKWSDHKEKGTDFAYLTGLLKYDPSVRWVDVTIGEKLLDKMP